MNTTMPSNVSDALAAGGIVSVLIFLVLFILTIVAYFLSIGLLIRAIKEKGHHTQGAGKLWLVGIFGTPMTLALYAIALPDRARGGMSEYGNRFEA